MTITRVIFTDEQIEIGRYLRAQGDRAAFALGDVCVELVDKYKPLPKVKTLEDYADEIGVEATTLHVYEWLSRKVMPDLREEFPVLSWSQWRACANAGERFIEVAGWAVASADHYGGKPAPTRVIYAKINAGLVMLSDEPTETVTHMGKPVNILLKFKRWFSNGAAEATCPHCRDTIALSEWAETWYQGEKTKNPPD